MENLFASFTPVNLNPNPSKEEISQYYIDNPEDIDSAWGPGKDFINNYLGLNESPFSPSVKADKTYIPPKYDIKSILGQQPTSEQKFVLPPIKIPLVKNKITDEIKSLNKSDEDKEFLIKMAQAESGFDPYVTNSLGYYGLYQFGKSALKTVGMTKSDFKDTKNQHEAALKLADLNEKTNKSLFEKYVGTWKNGVLITRNGLRAVHALLGVRGVREWLEGGNTTWTAKHGHKDAYGTSPEKYLKLFV